MTTTQSQARRSSPASRSTTAQRAKTSTVTELHSSDSSDSSGHEGVEKDRLEVLPEDQLRIIEQSGILDRIPLQRASDHQVDRTLPNRKPLLEFSSHELDPLSQPSSSLPPDDDRQDTLPLWVDRAFDTFLWSIPFNTVFICLDVAIHAQYGQPVSFLSELGRLKHVYPSSVFVIHYSVHHSEELVAKLLLFSLSTIGGSYMVYVMNRLSYLLVMKRVPPLGALWIFAVVRMHLSHAVVSLLLVALWCWVMDLSIYV